MGVKARRTETIGCGRGRGALVEAEGVDQAWREAEARFEFGGFRPFSERRRQLLRLMKESATWHNVEEEG